MSDVKPWEPVSGGWTAFGIWPWRGVYTDCGMVGWGALDALYVTLANGQRIIVRALSDERKAARVAMKEAVS